MSVSSQPHLLHFHSLLLNNFLLGQFAEAVFTGNENGFREVLGAAEGMKEDKASWVSFFQWLRGRGLDSVKLIVGDKCMGMLEAVGEVPALHSAFLPQCFLRCA